MCVSDKMRQNKGSVMGDADRLGYLIPLVRADGPMAEWRTAEDLLAWVSEEEDAMVTRSGVHSTSTRDARIGTVMACYIGYVQDGWPRTDFERFSAQFHCALKGVEYTDEDEKRRALFWSLMEQHTRATFFMTNMIRPMRFVVEEVEREVVGYEASGEPHRQVLTDIILRVHAYNVEMILNAVPSVEEDPMARAATSNSLIHMIPLAVLEDIWRGPGSVPEDYAAAVVGLAMNLVHRWVSIRGKNYRVISTTLSRLFFRVLFKDSVTSNIERLFRDRWLSPTYSGLTPMSFHSGVMWGLSSIIDQSNDLYIRKYMALEDVSPATFTACATMPLERLLEIVKTIMMPRPVTTFRDLQVSIALLEHIYDTDLVEVTAERTELSLLHRWRAPVRERDYERHVRNVIECAVPHLCVENPDPSYPDHADLVWRLSVVHACSSIASLPCNEVVAKVAHVFGCRPIVVVRTLIPYYLQRHGTRFVGLLRMMVCEPLECNQIQPTDELDLYNAGNTVIHLIVSVCNLRALSDRDTKIRKDHLEAVLKVTRQKQEAACENCSRAEMLAKRRR